METKYPVGVCNQMCPEQEITRRKKDRLIHILEMSPDSFDGLPNAYRMVKEFRRSAAGQKVQNIKNLRTPDALMKTIEYLLHDVIIRDDLKWHVIYEFIANRFRAVRQDMVIQNLSRSFCICLLQPMIKFYVYSAYRLCEEPISNFDPHLNKTHLQECLKRLLCIYDEMDVLITKVCLKKVDLKYKNLLYSECRPFMESLYLILNMGNTVALNRAVQLPETWKKPLIKKCFEISINYWQNNYVRVCREICSLPLLLSAYAFLQLPYIRKRALATMNVAYSCKNMTFPLKKLQDILLYENEQKIIEDCTYYGIEANMNKIIFSKTGFNVNKKLLLPKHSKLIDEKLVASNLPRLLLEDEDLDSTCFCYIKQNI